MLDNTIDLSINKINIFEYRVREIWWVAAFQIPCEPHEFLSWVFAYTKIPAFIKAQGQGQLLHVEVVGSFSKEWHIYANMKTIKCLCGLRHGPNSPRYYTYCNQTLVKSVVLTRQQVKSVISSHYTKYGIQCLIIFSVVTTLSCSTLIFNSLIISVRHTCVATYMCCHLPNCHLLSPFIIVNFFSYLYLGGGGSLLKK
jgi:hypothetical protein